MCKQGASPMVSYLTILQGNLILPLRILRPREILRNSPKIKVLNFKLQFDFVPKLIFLPPHHTVSYVCPEVSQQCNEGVREAGGSFK